MSARPQRLTPQQELRFTAWVRDYPSSVPDEVRDAFPELHELFNEYDSMVDIIDLDFHRAVYGKD